MHVCCHYCSSCLSKKFVPHTSLSPSLPSSLLSTSLHMYFSSLISTLCRTLGLCSRNVSVMRSWLLLLTCLWHPPTSPEPWTLEVLISPPPLVATNQLHRPTLLFSFVVPAAAHVQSNKNGCCCCVAGTSQKSFFTPACQIGTYLICQGPSTDPTSKTSS